MIFDTTTPAVLFSVISLLLLAYTNRFLVTASRLRGLRLNVRVAPNNGLARQIANLRKRLRLIRGMQALGVISLIASVTVMLFAVNGALAMARGALMAGLLLPGLMALAALLVLALREISISLAALDVERADPQHA